MWNARPPSRCGARRAWPRRTARPHRARRQRRSRQRAVIGYADQKVTSFCVEKRGDRLEHRVRHDPVVLSVFFEVPPKSRFKLKRLRLTALNQVLGVAVCT